MNHPADPTVHNTDVLIIGAGPAGLWAAFELGLLSCDAHIVDALPHAGGQVTQLYGDKPIYDVPGVPLCTGEGLTASLMRQLAPLAVPMHWRQTIQSLTRDGQHWRVRSDTGNEWRCRALLIAAGVGAFAPRKLRGLDFSALEGHSVHYHAPQAADALSTTLSTQHCVVYGGAEAALATAVRLSQLGAQTVTLVYRRDVLQAEADTLKQFGELQAQGRIRVVTGMVGGFVASGAQLHALNLNHPNASSSRLPADQLWVMEGLSSQLGAIGQWGLAMTRKQLQVDPCTLSTSEAGIHAVGDVVHYPNKRRLIISAMHEATQAAYAIADALHPAGLGPQEYTSSSARLQKKLQQP